MMDHTAAIHLHQTRLTISTPRYRADAAAVIFDLDGVLVDSHPQIDQALRRWAINRGIDLTQRWQEAHALTDPEFIALAAPHLDVQSETHALRTIEHSLAATTRAYPGAEQTYGSLPEQLRCIVTSGARETVQARLRAAGLPEPAVLVTAEDVHFGKPDPAPYLLAFERLGVSPRDTVVVEDSPSGVRSAHAAGAAVIGIAKTSNSTNELAQLQVVDCVPQLTGITIDRKSIVGQTKTSELARR